MKSTNKEEKYTFEMVWQALMENREQIKELAEDRKATDRIIKELAEDRKATDKQIKENDRLLKEKFAETDRLIKENSKQIGGISNSNGKMAEEMIYNALDKNKTFANVKFDYLRKNVKNIIIEIGID